MLLSVVVPCYNESDNVAKLREELYPILAGLLEKRPTQNPQFDAIELIFVDDGSRDQTQDKLKEAFAGCSRPSFQICFEQHPTNLGLGAAIRTGFSASHGDIVLTLDSDGTYTFSTIPELLSLMQPGVDLVTASPYHPQGGVDGVPANRLILSKGSSFLYRMLVSWKIHTYTCLYRAYRSSIVHNIPFSSNGFLANTEILVKALNQGYQVREYPAVLYKRMYGVSKAKILQTIRAHLTFQGQVLWMRVTQFH